MDIVKKFRPHPKVSKLRKELKCVLNTLGNLRDLQNQEKYLGRRLKPGELLKFQLDLKKKRKKVQKRAKARLKRMEWKQQDLRYKVLYENLVRRSKSPQQSKQAKGILKSTLNNQFKDLRRCAHHIVASSPPSFHRTRIAFKKFRYAWEALSRHYPISQQTSVQIKEIQNGLGKTQDATVLLRFLYEFLVDSKETNPSSELIQFIRAVERDQKYSIRYFVSHQKNLLSKLGPKVASLSA